MIINDLLKEKNLTMYRLHKDASIPQATISDICSGKTSLSKCNAETLYKLSKVLGVSMEYLLESSMENSAEPRPSFETFKSNTCHFVKDMGDIDFIIDTLESDRVRQLYNKKWYPEAFYLLAMLDYLSRENDLPICGNYNDIRSKKLKTPIYPASLLISCAALGNNKEKEKCYNTAIPEFKRFNIMESEVRNVY